VNVLGIDTSTGAVAACVLRRDGEAFEAEPAAGDPDGRPAHGSELLAAAAACVERSGLGWDGLDAVAIGVGPGGFTGLRIGVATARGIALARGLELRPVSSLAALAAGADERLALALIDARRGELFAALYDAGEEVWSPFAASLEAIADRVRNSGIAPLACGDGSVRFREALEAAGVRVAPGDSRSHVVRGLSICRLATAVEPAPAGAVLPDYLREPDVGPATP
jgi:tRNA threonylcarbamoyladenosine biosynthesis protein TsaB